MIVSLSYIFKKILTDNKCNVSVFSFKYYDWIMVNAIIYNL